jgi:hypothetical protein
MKFPLHISKTVFLVVSIGLAGLAGCSSTAPVRYTGLASSPQLRPTQGDDADHTPYSFSTAVNWRQYTNVILNPVAIYTGADQQFEDISEDDKLVLAEYMQAQLKQRLRARFNLVSTPVPGTLRIAVILTGAKTTTRGLSTFTRFDLGGGPYNIVQSIRGKEGSFTGNISYAVEIVDAPTNALLAAYVTKQYPNALNISASLGLLDASKTGIDKGVDELALKIR